MDFDDLPTKKASPVTAVEKEDLSSISVDELEDRIVRLEAEVERTKAEIKAKQGSLNAAEAFFKS
ncbi:MAG: DUF1192 domain-containing protein [Kordiimonadaceae bacterium]|nr:DUF1192 domain-containing protein [Kordiimonadaceae bacterium]